MRHARVVRFENLNTTASLPVAPPVPSGCSSRSCRLHRGAGLGVATGRRVGGKPLDGQVSPRHRARRRCSSGELPGLVDSGRCLQFLGAHEHVIASMMANVAAERNRPNISKVLWVVHLDPLNVTSAGFAVIGNRSTGPRAPALFSSIMGAIYGVRRWPRRIRTKAPARRFSCLAENRERSNKVSDRVSATSSEMRPA